MDAGPGELFDRGAASARAGPLLLTPPMQGKSEDRFRGDFLRFYPPGLNRPAGAIWGARLWMLYRGRWWTRDVLPGETLSVIEAAALSGVTRTTVYYWLKARKLETYLEAIPGDLLPGQPGWTPPTKRIDVSELRELCKRKGLECRPAEEIIAEKMAADPSWMRDVFPLDKHADTELGTAPKVT